MNEPTSRRDLLRGAAHVAAGVPLLSLAACGLERPAGAVERVRGRAMGTTYTLALWRRRARGDTLRLHALVAGIFRRISARLSAYRRDSDVVRFNRDPSTRWVAVGPETVHVVERALAWSRASQGAFDPTVAPLVDLWGFGPARGPRRTPSARRLAAVRARVGFGALRTRRAPPALRRARPGVQVDLSAIAQGHALDEAARALRERGVEDFLLELGGEVRAHGRRPDGRPWQVAVQRPGATGPAPLCVVPLRDGAMATSGILVKSFEEHGVRRSHILDPRRGAPVTHDLPAATVVADESVHADAAATVLVVLGGEAGARLARSRGLAALWVRGTDAEVETMRTPAFARLVETASG